jgi:hypothetical protein
MDWIHSHERRRKAYISCQIKRFMIHFIMVTPFPFMELPDLVKTKLKKTISLKKLVEFSLIFRFSPCCFRHKIVFWIGWKVDQYWLFKQFHGNPDLLSIAEELIFLKRYQSVSVPRMILGDLFGM